jgi:hypothetical protein
MGQERRDGRSDGHLAMRPPGLSPQHDQDDVTAASERVERLGLIALRGEHRNCYWRWSRAESRR